MKEEPDELARMTRLIQRLKKGSSVRLVAETLLDGKKPHQDQIPQLLKVLDKPRYLHWEEQEIAVWALGHISPEAMKQYQVVPKLQTVLEWAFLHRSRFYSTFWLMFLPCCWITFMIGFMLSGSGNAPNYIFYLMLVCLIALMFVSIRYSVVHNNRLLRIQAAAVNVLVNLGSVVSVSTLIEVIQQCSDLTFPMEGRRLESAAREALSSLLPSLSEDDYSYLPTATTVNLCWLARQIGEPLALPALEALGKVGDGRAIPVVEKLAAYGETKALQETAERILPILNDRQQRAEDRRALLRTADTPAVPSETLVRPVGNVQDTEPGQLLRPSNQAE